MFNYIKIARPDHWFKNVFMLPGTALALIMFPGRIDAVPVDFILGVLGTCLIASANYVINEYLDLAFDKFHPVKKNRPSVSGLILPQYVVLEYFLLAGIGIFLAWRVGKLFFFFSVLLLFMGLLYNIRPFRLKDRVFMDVLSESFNNPLRFLLGWHIVEKVYLPPASILLAYWFGGAFLMAVKRYAEFNSIADAGCAGRYRRSFRFYTRNSLLLSAFFYAMNSVFFLGVFLIKYRIEFILSFPLLSLLFSWYLWFGLRGDSVAEKPEELYLKRKFLLLVATVVIVIVFLFFYDIPGLEFLMQKHLVGRLGIVHFP